MGVDAERRPDGRGAGRADCDTWMVEVGGGSIVNISSIAGMEAGGFPASCGAAKAALISLAKSLAVTLAPQKIRVNAVARVRSNSPGDSGSR